MENIIIELNEKYRRKGEYEGIIEQLKDVESNINEYNRLLREIDSIPFNTKAATTFGELYQSFPSRRKSTFDKMIAAHAISLDITLVTNNVADFSLYETCGLRLENWVA